MPTNWGARSFNGTNQTITLGSSSNYSFERTNTWTIAAWINPNVNRSVATATGIFSKLNSSSPNNGFEFTLDTNDNVAGKAVLQFFIVNTFGTNFAAGYSTNDVTNAWHHVAWTYSGNSLVSGNSLYLDGVSQSVTTASNTLSATILNSITACIASRNNVNSYFNGNEADVAVWNVVLSPLEIAALAKGVRPDQIRQPNSVLIGWWPLDGLQSPEPDLSGRDTNGTLVNAPPAVFGPPFAPQTPRWPQEVFAPPFQAAWARGKNIVVEGVAT